MCEKGKFIHQSAEYQIRVSKQVQMAEETFLKQPRGEHENCGKRFIVTLNQITESHTPNPQSMLDHFLSSVSISNAKDQVDFATSSECPSQSTSHTCVHASFDFYHVEYGTISCTVNLKSHHFQFYIPLFNMGTFATFSLIVLHLH